MPNQALQPTHSRSLCYGNRPAELWRWAQRRSVVGDQNNETRQRDVGLGISFGTALGLAFGSGFGVVSGNLAIGMGIGLAFGIAVGALLGSKRAKAASA